LSLLDLHRYRREVQEEEAVIPLPAILAIPTELQFHLQIQKDQEEMGNLTEMGAVEAEAETTEVGQELLVHLDLQDRQEALAILDLRDPKGTRALQDRREVGVEVRLSHLIPIGLHLHMD
jgi:hypothetical protein